MMHKTLLLYCRFRRVHIGFSFGYFWLVNVTINSYL